MTAAQSSQRHRLESLLNAVGAPQLVPTQREDGLTGTVRLDEYDHAAITAAGEDTAVLTIVTTTAKGRRILKTLARAYGIEPGLRGL